jgi:CubicO group peptidase (beta-lactamase class C family)
MNDPVLLKDFTSIYFPPPESQGGWRFCLDNTSVHTRGGMDSKLLDQVCQRQEFLHGGDSWGIVIIRHGWLVREFYTFNVLIPTRFDIFSGTKSFTGTAWGMLLEDCQRGLFPGYETLTLDSPAYPLITAGYPLTDARKERITLRHLLSMTAGLPGEDRFVIGMPTSTGIGPFEHALGRAPNRYGYWVDKLVSEPGTRWDYSDAGMAHLALAFVNVAGQEISEYLHQRVFESSGIENLSWDIQGGSGCLGPHTNAHTGIHISARELARFGYLALHSGNWNGQQLIPSEWMALATRSSQELNPAYGFTWWVNTSGTQWPSLPGDAFALSGYRSNRCYIIPSLDLVVARVGSGPPEWDEQSLITSVVSAILT